MLSTKSNISGTVAKVSCGVGFTLFGDTVLECQTDGSWNSSVGNCRKGNYAILVEFYAISINEDYAVYFYIVPCILTILV